jgi:hypothetical protein
LIVRYYSNFAKPRFLVSFTFVTPSLAYPVQTCQSPDDEIVPNIEEHDFSSLLLTVTGNHNQAGGFCLLQAIAFLGSGTVRNYPIPELHSSDGCQAESLDILEQGRNLSNACE